jgi:hypothetical protein
VPRNPKIRASYTDDARYLLRLSHAIEMDKVRPEKWRKEMIAKVNQLAQDFMKAPEGKAA